MCPNLDPFGFLQFRHRLVATEEFRRREPVTILQWWRRLSLRIGRSAHAFLNNWHTDINRPQLGEIFMDMLSTPPRTLNRSVFVIFAAFGLEK